MAKFVVDNFTDTAGTTLASHTGETGATWTKNGSYSSGEFQITDANRLRKHVTAASAYYASGTPNGSTPADYTVTGRLREISSNSQFMAVAGRMDTSANTMYAFRYDQRTTWRLNKLVAGTNTSLGTFSETLADGDERTFQLSMVGSTIKGFVSGVERVNVTDTAITAAGKAGIRSSGSTADTNSTGHHLDWIEAEDDSVAGQTISPSSISSLEAFGSDTLTPGNVNISPSGLASLEAFGTTVLNVGGVSISPSGIASLEAFGTHVLTVFLVPTGIDSAEAFGSHTINVGVVTVSPSGIDSAEALGAALVSSGGSFVEPSGISSLESFGTLTLTVGVVSISPNGIASLEEFGSDTVSPGAVTISVSSISSAESFGDLLVSLGVLTLAPSAISSLEAFGTQTVTTGNVNISPTGIASSEVFGTSTVQLFVVPTGIVSAEAFGTSTFTIGAAIISPTGIASVLTFGTVTIDGGEPIVVALAQALVRLYEYTQAEVRLSKANAEVEIS